VATAARTSPATVLCRSAALCAMRRTRCRSDALLPPSRTRTGARSRPHQVQVPVRKGRTSAASTGSVAASTARCAMYWRVFRQFGHVTKSHVRHPPAPAVPAVSKRNSAFWHARWQRPFHRMPLGATHTYQTGQIPTTHTLQQNQTVRFSAVDLTLDAILSLSGECP
jgi:hypothetical protein